MGPNSGGGKKSGGKGGKGGGKRYDKLGRPLNFGNYKNGVLKTGGGGKGKGAKKGGRGSGKGGRGGGKGVVSGGGSSGRGGGKKGGRGRGGGAKATPKPEEKAHAVSLSAADEAKVRSALGATAGGVERFVANRYAPRERVSCLYAEDGEWYDAVVQECLGDDCVFVRFEGYDGEEGDAVVQFDEIRARATRSTRNARGAGAQRAAVVPPAPKGAPLRAQRESLPAFEHRARIVDAIAQARVTVIEGDTGCGKTTQVPQFVLEDAAARNEKCSIIVAQPRRISAMGVAERVAAERGEACGRGAVGYTIRLESKTCRETCLLFCTTGILMRRLGEDPDLEGVTHVFVDEVHERTIESDFLLMVLRDLLDRNAAIKLILMSATLDANLFATYFRRLGDVPTVCVPGRAYPVAALYLEAALELTQHRVRAAADWARRGGKGGKGRGGGRGGRGAGGKDAKAGDWTCAACGAGVFASKDACFKCGAKRGDKGARPPSPPEDETSLDEAAFGKRYPATSPGARASLLATDFDVINYDLCAQLVTALVDDFDGPAAVCAWAARKGFLPPPATTSSDSNVSADDAILVFLPGAKEIQTLHELLTTGRFRQEPQRSWILPLHSLLPPEDQKQVFKRPPKGCRKVILATNIAETAITIDDVSFVVDTGRMKEKRFDAARRMESLEDTSVCRSNAKQRRGRAGRTRPGCSFHLLTSWRHDYEVGGHQEPEVRRVPLERLCLTTKALGYEQPVAKVLAALLEPPAPASVATAVDALETLGAIERSDGGETLTALGHHLSLLPCDARIGKYILLGAIFGAIDETLTIAAVLTSRSPFVSPFALRDAADAEKRSFAGDTQSDHLAALRAYAEYDSITGNARYDFARSHFLGIKSLQQIGALKRQFLELLSEAGFAPPRLRARQVEALGRRNGGADGVRAALAGAGGGENDDWRCPKCHKSVFASKTKCFSCGAPKPPSANAPATHRIESSDSLADAPLARVGSNSSLADLRADAPPDALLKALLCAALYPQIAAVEYKESKGKGGGAKFKIREQGAPVAKGATEAVALHPSSVNSALARFETPYCAYAEKLKTGQVYLRDTTPASPYALMLFGGALGRKDGVLSVDGWIKFRVPKAVEDLVMGIRVQLDGLLCQKIENPDLALSDAGQSVLGAVHALLDTPLPRC